MLQRVQNTRIKNYFIDILKLNPIQDVIPDYVRQDIQPVVEVDKPVINISRRGTAANATSGTIYTTPTDKDFYLTAATLSMIKDATATSVNSDISATIDGVAQRLMEIKGIISQAQEGSLSQSWHIPIKVDRGTNITCNNSTANANVTVVGCIQGYTDIKGGV